ncbi:TAL effector repeat-containing protein [Paraburkholderia bonniea]|uniref:TAL effector repeat-containing protein n=1 Tax=Paraburkholderia bonniea TaxID=2152891 RepID=UPI001290C007|nr:TAL effector repeat-containing protein [Paraburkholderia bonniea]
MSQQNNADLHGSSVLPHAYSSFCPACAEQWGESVAVPSAPRSPLTASPRPVSAAQLHSPAQVQAGKARRTLRKVGVGMRSPGGELGLSALADAAALTSGLPEVQAVQAATVNAAHAAPGFTLSLAEREPIHAIFGGRMALNWLSRHGQALTHAPYGLTKAQLLRIAGNDGGVLALEKVRTAHAGLRQQGYSNTQIVKLAGNAGGALALGKVRTLHAGLMALGYSRVQIVSVAGNVGGAAALEKVWILHARLVLLGYSLADMVRVARCAGAAAVLEQLVTMHDALVALGYTRAGVLRIALAGALALERVWVLHAGLSALGYTRAEIVTMAAQGGAVALGKVKLLHSGLSAHGHERAEIVTMAAQADGAAILEKVWARYGKREALERLGTVDTHD